MGNSYFFETGGKRNYGQTFSVINCGLVRVLPRVLRSECRSHAAEATVGKAEHSESLMKRDSEVCWSRMRLSLLQDPSEQRTREPVIEYCCWPVVKLQLNSFSIIITICFPYRVEIGG